MVRISSRRDIINNHLCFSDIFIQSDRACSGTGTIQSAGSDTAELGASGTFRHRVGAIASLVFDRFLALVDKGLFFGI